MILFEVHNKFFNIFNSEKTLISIEVTLHFTSVFLPYLPLVTTNLLSYLTDLFFLTFHVNGLKQTWCFVGLPW